MKCGLLGGKLGHSFSPQIHGKLGEYEYLLYEKEPEELCGFLTDEAANPWQGLNVTIPYKKEVMKYCDELSPLAKRIGSVNTLVRRYGKIFGDNTDYYGFGCMVKKLGVSVAGKKALILGNGGVALPVKAVLEDEKAGEIIIISRSGENNYENITRHADAEIIVNTTPLGMYPDVGKKAISLAGFHKCEAVFDLIFNPLKTALMLEAEELNVPHMDGLLMLVAQAKKASEIFRDIRIEDSVIEEISDDIRKEVENIVLIGMPGCGKSTIGRILADKLNKKFVDLDEVIVKRAGMSIPEIFSLHGENGFRKLEKEVVADICKEKGQVIATGGGVVTVAANKQMLRQNAVVIFIERELSELSTNGRPISLSRPLQDIYNERIEAYNSWSDYRVSNIDISETVLKIQEVL